jgi:hypothetical protein
MIRWTAGGSSERGLNRTITFLCKFESSKPLSLIVISFAGRRAALLWQRGCGDTGGSPQAIPAQAIAAFDGHGQARGLLRAPAVAREVAAEFRSATGTDEAAGR